MDVPAPPVAVAAFYKFVALPDFADLKPRLEAQCRRHNILGTILLAGEGINGTISGSANDIDGLLSWLARDPRLAGVEAKFSRADEPPFHRMKVRLKKEIVTLGIDGVDPVGNAGTYVAPADWNALISDPEVVLVDVRNDYEVAIGSFRGAKDPGTKSFRDLPDWARRELDARKDTRIAMFCTGGIRCEKSTALLKSEGFDSVYHLRGGILKYLEQVPEAESLWRGECFVFDQRVSVGHGLKPGPYDLCHACRHPISAEDKASPHYVMGVSCPRCHDEHSARQVKRFADRQKQMELAKRRGGIHIAADIEQAKARKRRERQARAGGPANA